MSTPPLVVTALDQPLRARPSNYPEPFASRIQGRRKHPLGDLFGLTNFGVNLTVLPPGAISALRHAHTRQDEFIYIVSGTAVLRTEDRVCPMGPGQCAGFKAGTGNGHQLENQGDVDVVYLEVGDRTAGDEVSYPDDDLSARLVDGAWQFFHKNGEPY